MIQSSLYVEGKAEGRTEGRTEGRAEGREAGREEGQIENARAVCAALALKHHPAVFERVEGVIAACVDPARLMDWIVRASDVSDAEFLDLVVGGSPVPRLE